MSFLPTNREEMIRRGYDELDILLVTGDFYVDHPSFGVSILGHLLEAEGYRVGLIFQPDWKKSFTRAILYTRAYLLLKLFGENL